MTLNNVPGSLENLANTAVDITDALEEKGEVITGLSEAGEAIRRLANGEGDGITVNSGDLINSVASDVAINADLDDLASNRGQIGQVPQGVSTDLNEYKKAGKWYILNTYTNMPIASAGYVEVYSNSTVVTQVYYPNEDINQDMSYTRTFVGNTWTNWIKNISSSNVNPAIEAYLTPILKELILEYGGTQEEIDALG